MTNDRRASQQADVDIPTTPAEAKIIEVVETLKAPDHITLVTDDTVRRAGQYSREIEHSEVAVKRYQVRAEADGTVSATENPMGKYCLASEVLELRRQLVKRAKKAEALELEAVSHLDVLEDALAKAKPNAKMRRLYQKLAEARRDKETLIEMNNKLSHRVSAQYQAMQAQADAEAQMYQQLDAARMQAQSLEWFKAFDKLAKAVHELMTTYPGLVVQSGSVALATNETPVSRDAFVALVGARDAVAAQLKAEASNTK